MASFIPKLVYGSTPTTVLFDFPPRSDTDEQFTSNKNESIALSGLRQVSVNRIDVDRTVVLDFLTLAKVQELQTFFSNWGAYGKSFSWYESQEDVGSLITYEISDLKLGRGRSVEKGDHFLYSVTMKFRRYQ
jgi:hypothetical protein